jgi:hypothetical protein
MEWKPCVDTDHIWTEGHGFYRRKEVDFLEGVFHRRIVSISHSPSSTVANKRSSLHRALYLHLDILLPIHLLAPRVEVSSLIERTQIITSTSDSSIDWELLFNGTSVDDEMVVIIGEDGEEECGCVGCSGGGERGSPESPCWVSWDITDGLTVVWESLSIHSTLLSTLVDAASEDMKKQRVRKKVCTQLGNELLNSLLDEAN